MSGKEIDWEFLKELECPVCLEYMASPIKMCENGHNICGVCEESLPECPACRGKFVNVRNITLEKFATNAIYPCKNKEAGCEEAITREDRGSHLSECLFQIRECPFRKLSGVDCSWTGTLSDIAVHLVGEHENETDELQGHFKVELLDFAVGRSYRKAVFIVGELFYLVWETEGDIFSFGVFHFGPNNETNDFKYGIKIGNSEEHVTVTRKCHSYIEGGLKDMQPGKCVTLHYGTIQECLGENGKLSCEIEIRKWELEGFVVVGKQEYLQVCCAICSSETNSGSWAIAEQQQQLEDELEKEGVEEEEEEGAEVSRNALRPRGRFLHQLYLRRQQRKQRKQQQQQQQ
jgi:hypothetical protein